jgi:hypothetical protein
MKSKQDMTATFLLKISCDTAYIGKIDSDTISDCITVTIRNVRDTSLNKYKNTDKKRGYIGAITEVGRMIPSPYTNE